MECWQLHDQSHRIVANCVIASEELNSIAFVTLYLMLALSLHSLRHVRASSGRPSRWLRSLLVENLQHMSTLSNLAPSQDVIDILTKSQAVCFDVDSTVISEEGIDELAGYKGVGEEVANLTKK